jgi:hypothetical protein
MTVVTRANTGAPSASHPYVDPESGEVGITTGDTIAVRVTPPADVPVEAEVVAGDGHVTIGAAPPATDRRCTVRPGELLHVRGGRTTVTGPDDAHGDCRIELRQDGAPIGSVVPRVHDPLDLKVRLWLYDVAVPDPWLPGGPATVRPLSVYGEEVDVRRLMTDVTAYWRPAGINVVLAGVNAGRRLGIDRTRKIQDTVHAGLRADADLTRALGRAEEVNVVLVPYYDRLGFTFWTWGRLKADQAQAERRKDLAGFAGPVVIVAVNGAIAPDDLSWASRSTDVAAFHGLPDTTAAGEERHFHYTSLACDIAHELGHALGLAHPEDPPLGSARAAYVATTLMATRPVADGKNWGEPGWPATLRNRMTETRTGSTLTSPVAAHQATETLDLAKVTVGVPAGTGLTLVGAPVVQPVVLREEIPANRPCTVKVDRFEPQVPFPVGTPALKQADNCKMLRGGLVPTRSATWARQHITSRRVYGATT